MLVWRTIHKEHASGVVVCVILTTLLLVVQASTVPAQVIRPQSPESTFRGFESFVIPREAIWADRISSQPSFSSRQEIDSTITRAARTLDETDRILRGSQVRNANFKAVYLHTFDQSKNYGRSAVDYLIPFQSSNKRVRFADVHCEFENMGHFSRSDRIDLAIGLGQRTISRQDYFIGANAFLDASSISDRWYWSGSLGFEAALNLSPPSKTSQKPFEVLDFSLNLYRGGGLELESGLSLRLNDYADLRFNLAKYRFYDGEYLLGWKGGADIRASSGLFILKYEYGQDRVDSSYHTVGASISVPLQLENLLEGRWPFSVPDSFLRGRPDFQTLASGGVKRSWHHPPTVVTARPSLGIWEAPGNVRWDWGQEFSPEFSPTEDFWKHSARPAKEKDDFFAVIGHTVSRVALTAIVGVLEYGYRWVFGPYKSRVPENPEPFASMTDGGGRPVR